MHYLVIDIIIITHFICDNGFWDMDIVHSLLMLFGGVGLFLYGLVRFEESVEGSSSEFLQKFIEISTKTTFRGFVTGIFSTIVMQSSSLVTVIVLWLVWGNMMGLLQAVWVILWTNVWTTFTARLVSLWWVKFNVGILAFPLLWLWWFLALLKKKTGAWHNFVVFILGFGFILLGLEYMKESFAFLQTAIDLSLYHDLPTIFFLLLSILLTVVVQSSTAMTTIILAAFFANAITFDAALVMVIWANIGTTITAVLWALWWSYVQKQVAGFHVLFNVVTGVIVYAMLPIFVWVISSIWLEKPIIQLAMFHTLFNLFGVLLFMPLLSHVLRFLQRTFPEWRDFWSYFPWLKKFLHHEDVI